MEASSLLQPLRQAMRPSGELFRAFLAELLATALFVFLGCGSVAATGEFLVDDSASGITVDVARVLPIATTFGLAITVLAFGIGPISGGHINPGAFFRPPTCQLMVYTDTCDFNKTSCDFLFDVIKKNLCF